MALIPKNDYTTRVDDTDPDYPQGKAINLVGTTRGTGTPLEEKWVNDDWGFKQAILDEAGITPSGSPDSVGASDYLDGLKRRLDRTFSNVADMKASTWLKVGDYVKTLGYYSENDGGSAEYVVVPNGTGTEDGGSYLDLGNGLQVELLYTDNVHIKQLGIQEGSDGTSQWEMTYPNLPDSTTVNFGNGTYLGSFLTNKKLNLIGEGAIITNVLDNTKIIGIDSYIDNTPTEYNVTESVLNNGDTEFTIVGASGLFQEGDIGYLWDSAVFPSGSSRVNTECVKIDIITGDLIKVVGIIHAHKGAGAIKFIHSTNQIQDVEIKGFIINPTPTHTQLCCFVQGVSGVNISDVVANSFTGSCVRTDFCYDTTIRRIRPLNPINTGSGQGYGVENRGCTTYSAHDIKGIGCRHVYDADSIYNWNIYDIEDMEDKSAPINISHTGFCGYGNVEKVRVKTPQYPITGNETGYGSGVNEATKANHPMRDVTIRDVVSTVREDRTPNDSNVSGVYIRSNVENVLIDNISVTHANFVIPTGTNNNNIIRIDGIAIGQFSIKNINADGAGRAFFSTGDSDGVGTANEMSVVEDIYVTYCWEPIFVQGSWRLFIDKLGFNDIGSSNLIKAENLSGQPTLGMYIGDIIHYDGVDVQLYNHLNNEQTDGRLEGLPRSMQSSVSVVDGDVLTYTEIQNKKGSISLVPPDGTPITMDADALPLPLINGQRLSIYNTLNASDGDRGDITFPSGGTVLNAFTITDDGKPRHVVSRNGLWVEN